MASICNTWQSINSRSNSKYFGIGRGVTYYNYTSDQFTGFNGIVISGTIRDSLYLLQGILEQQTVLQPREVMTDTAGYSDIIFGLFGLLGYQFSPRLADIGSSRFWKLNHDADYGVLNKLAKWYMQLAIESLQKSGHNISIADIQRLSPLGYEHINIMGKYSFNLSKEIENGMLRSLMIVEDEIDWILNSNKWGRVVTFCSIITQTPINRFVKGGIKMENSKTEETKEIFKLKSIRDLVPGDNTPSSSN